MITSLRLVNFKNFADETLRVGPFTVIVGANASGKSNIRDAFRFLHGIGRGYTLAEIMGGKYGEGGQREWEGIRGATNEVARFRQSECSLEAEITSPIEIDPRGFDRVDYSIRIHRGYGNVGRFFVTAESLRDGAEILYECDADSKCEEGGLYDGDNLHAHLPDGQTESRFESDRPVIRQLFDRLLEPVSDAGWSGWTCGEGRLMRCSAMALEAVRRVRFLELVPDRMRDPSFPGATTLGDHGENLPTVLEEICSDRGRQETLASWIDELTPMDVAGFEFPRDPNGRVNLVIRERNGRKVSAYSASDGTLRFLAMLAALLGAKPTGVYFFEEIDNGIHPTRLHLLIDLIERQTAKNGIQVITTTHSPDVLNLINDNTFRNTSVVYRDEDSADAIIRPAVELPKASELRKSQGLGRLHSTGWIEDMLAFAEAGSEDEEAQE